MMSRWGKVAAVLCTLAVAVIVVVILSMSFKRLEFEEVGVKYDVTGRKLSGRVTTAGLYTGVPGFTFVKFPAIFKSIEFDDLKCYTFDGAEVRLDVMYQFKIFEQEIPNILKQFRDYDAYLKMLQLVGQSQLFKSCSHFSAYDLVANRIQFANMTEWLLKERYSGLHALINGLQINNIQRPTEYDEGQKKKEAVRENIQVKLKERPELLTYAETEKEKALAEAKIRIQDAERQARIALTVAANEAAVIRKQAQVDGEIYLKLMSAGNIDLRSYLAVEGISSAERPVKVNIEKGDIF